MVLKSPSIECDTISEIEIISEIVSENISEGNSIYIRK